MSKVSIMIKCFSPSNDNTKFPWVSNRNISIKGYVYIDGVLVSGEDMFYIFENIDNKLSFISLLHDLNGFFSVIIEHDDFVYAAVDRVNSTPLMYKLDNGFWVGDNYENFLGEKSRIDEDSFTQYLSSGYVYGEKTLIDDVSQLLPGTAVIYDKGKLTIKVEKYYEYLPRTTPIKYHLESEYVDQLDEVHKKVFGRLVDNLSGRQAVLPLSGGYDSRLILEMLLRFNYKNILCVTWGRETDWQAKIARNVTTKLGVDWVCVNQDADSWHKWFEEGGVKEQLKRCGALCSIPYVQENVLIKYLETKGLIENDAVFLNGNSGDFIEGQHIPENIKEDIGNDDVVDLISAKHLRLAKLSDPERIYKVIRDQVQLFRGRDLDVRLFFENWEWSERQSKFVTKCIKPFEAEGYEWRMPFWENEIMDFWANVPIDIKNGRKLFYSYFEKYMNSEVRKPNPVVPRMKVLYERLTDQRFGIFFKNLYGFNRLAHSTSRKFPSLLSTYRGINRESLMTVKLNSLLALHVASIIKERISIDHKDIK